MSPTDSLPNVVIVGGGGAGATIANQLSAQLDPTKYNLILITSRPFFTYLPAGIRTVVTNEGSLENRMFIPYDKNFVKGNGKLITDTVISIEESKEGGGSVVLSSGEKVDYSILVLSPGSIWEGTLAFPETKEGVLQWVEEWRKKFMAAEDIVLVGGGAVGVEHSGEIREFWPNKRVTIVHNQPLLMNDAYPDKWRKDVVRRIQDRGVQLVLDDYVDEMEPSSGSITTRKGHKITADLVIPTRGGKPNTSFIKTLGEDVLTPGGQVKVKPTLQLSNHPRIFAAGDVIDWAEQKQFAKAPSHADIVSKNILSLLAQKAPAAVYKGSYELIVVTNGKSRGATYLGICWGFTFGDRVSALLKSKHLMIGLARGALGYSD